MKKVGMGFPQVEREKKRQKERERKGVESGHKQGQGRLDDLIKMTFAQTCWAFSHVEDLT